MELSRDSAGRETDLAFDYAEFAHHSPETVQRVLALLQSHGMQTTVSSIHIHGCFGDFNKWTGACWIVRELLGRDLSTELDQVGVRGRLGQRPGHVPALHPQRGRGQHSALRAAAQPPADLPHAFCARRRFRRGGPRHSGSTFFCITNPHTGATAHPGSRTGLLAVFGSTLFQLSGVFMLSPLMLALLTEREVSTTIAGLFAATTWLGIFIVTPFASALTRRWGRRRAMWFAFGVPLAAAVGFLSTDSIAVWFVLELLAGIAGGMRWVLAEALIAEFSPPERLGRTMACTPPWWAQPSSSAPASWPGPAAQGMWRWVW